MGEEAVGQAQVLGSEWIPAQSGGFFAEMFSVFASHGSQGLPAGDQLLSQEEPLSVWSFHPELIKTVVPLMMAEILNCAGTGRGIVNLLEDAPPAFSPRKLLLGQRPL